MPGPAVLRLALTLGAVGFAVSTRLRNLQQPLTQTVQNATALASSGTHAGTNATTAGREGELPCQCVASSPTWKRPTRITPKCIFIDLGAADGNTFTDFLQGKYGEVNNCPSGGQWEAWLVEANPHFDASLHALQPKFPGLHVLASTAAYSCQATTTFYIDLDPTHNHWGSSMSKDAPEVIRSKRTKVTVPTLNVVQLIAENTIPGDWVMLKVDIEGAEYELVPCLAKSDAAGLVDRMYLEEHGWFPSGSTTTPQQMEDAKAQLRLKGVDIPPYFSHTL